jgi:hypothetical protein
LSSFAAASSIAVLVAAAVAGLELVGEGGLNAAVSADVVAFKVSLSAKAILSGESPNKPVPEVPILPPYYPVNKYYPPKMS